MGAKKGEPAGKFLRGLPDLNQPRPKPVFAFCFYAVLMALAGLAAMGSFFTGFELAPDVFPMALFGLLCLLLCCLQFQLGRWRWLAAFATVLLWALLVWLNYDVLVQGGVRTVNTMLAAYGERSNFTMPTLALPGEELSDRQYSVTLFSVFMQFPFYWLLSWAVIEHGSALGGFCITGLLLLAPLSFSIMPAPWALGAALLFWAFLLFSSTALRQAEGFCRERRRLQLPATGFLHPAGLLLLPLLALFLLAVYRFFPAEGYVRPEFANRVRDEINEVTDLPALFNGGTGSGGNRVNLASLKGRSHTGETVLRVRHQWQDDRAFISESPTAQKDYLKSFVGSVYTGDSWERLDSRDAAEAQELLGKNDQTLPARLSLALPVYTQDVMKSYQLTVRRVETDRRSVFSPYGLYAPDGLPDRLRTVGDGYVQSSSWFSAPEEYSLSAVALPASGSWLPDRYIFSCTENDQGYLTEGRELQEFFYRFLADWDADMSGNGSMGASDLWRIPDYALEVYEGKEPGLIETVEDYSAFVYEHYTRLPEETLRFAQDYLLENGLNPTEYPYRYADRYSRAQWVRDLLERNCRYTLNPPGLPEGEDFVRFFLSDSRQGYCVHFATAAVALLRAMGIPARYAEGYAVPVDLNGRWVDVPDFNAHAWVEIYWGGTGWLPFEVTPANSLAPAAYANARSPSGEELSHRPTEPEPTLPPRPTAEPSPSPSPRPSITPAASASPGGGGGSGRSENGGMRAFLRFIGWIALALSPFLLLWVIRRLRLLWRKHRFAQADRNKAALCIYAHLLRLFKENSALPYHGTKPSPEIEALALKARFSRHTLTEEEIGQLLDMVHLLESRLKEGLSPIDQWRCKYLLALF